ncbi:MAG: hypothetical protein QG626_159 [Patescibacteria group bacterium]|nr:hypothetical protein [Patescibacteria group bacterium]
MTPTDHVPELPDVVRVALDHPADTAGRVELRHPGGGPELDLGLEPLGVGRRAGHSGLARRVLDEGGVGATVRVHPDHRALVVIHPVVRVGVLHPRHAGVGSGLVEEHLLHTRPTDGGPVAPEGGGRPGGSPQGQAPGGAHRTRGVTTDPDRPVVAGGGRSAHDALGVAAPAVHPGDARVHRATNLAVTDSQSVEPGGRRPAGIEGAVVAHTPDDDTAGAIERTVRAGAADVAQVPDRDRAVGLTTGGTARDLALAVEVAPADDVTQRVVDVGRGRETTGVLVPAAGPGRPGHVRLEVDQARMLVGELDGGPLDRCVPLTDPGHPLDRRAVVRGHCLQRTVVRQRVAYVPVRVHRQRIRHGIREDVVLTDPGVACAGGEGHVAPVERGEDDRRHDAATQHATLCQCFSHRRFGLLELAGTWTRRTTQEGAPSPARGRETIRK